MRETLKRLIKLSAGYSLVTLIGPLFTLFLTPLYTRVLEPADYGVVDVALTLSALLGALAGFGIEGAVSAYYFETEDAERRNMATTAVMIVAMIGVIFSVSLFIFAPYLSRLVFHQVEQTLTLQVLTIHVFCAPLYALLSALLRLRMGIRRVNALGLSYLAVLIGLNVFLVLGLHLKANGIVMANAGAMFTGCVIGLALAAQPLRGKFSSAWARKLLITGVALLPASLSYLLLSNLDRLLLTQFVTQDEIGLYAIANKLASMESVVVSAVWAAWWPMALEMANTPDGKIRIARIYELFMAGSILLSLALGLFAPEILRFYTREAYVPAAPYAAWLFLYMGPIGLTAAFFQIGLYTKRQMRHISIALVFSVIVNVALNLLLDPAWRVWGATIATVVAGVVWAGYCVWSSQRAMFIAPNWGRICFVTALYLGILIINSVGQITWSARLLAVIAVAFFSLVLIVGLNDTRTFLQSARSRIKNFKNSI